MSLVIRADLPASLQSGELIDTWLAGLNARAVRLAPCLAQPTGDQLDEARLILIGIIKRWSEAGSGAVTTQAAGPFSQTTDTRERGGYRWWPSEITDLQALCANGKAKAFNVDSAPSAVGSAHLPWCSVTWGTPCSCGVDIAGVPIFEGAADVP